MSNTTKVFYIGTKALRNDSVLNHKHVSWAGYGSHQVVPDADAEVYFRYPTVWVSEEAFKKLAKTEAAVTKQVAATPVDSGLVKDPGPSVPDPGTPVPKPSDAGAAGDADRETLVQAAILQLKKDDPADYTAQGRPRVNRINEIAGTNVSAEEIDAAIKTLKHLGKLS